MKIYLDKYCTDLMFLAVMVCVILSSTKLSLIIFNFAFSSFQDITLVC